jgi:hypothetical protein
MIVCVTDRLDLAEIPPADGLRRVAERQAGPTPDRLFPLSHPR